MDFPPRVSLPVRSGPLAISTRTKEAMSCDQCMLAALQIRQAGPARELKSA